MVDMVQCPVCGAFSEAEKAVVLGGSNSIRLFRCEECEDTFYKLNYEISKDTSRFKAKNNCRLRKQIKNVEKCLSYRGEEIGNSEMGVSGNSELYDEMGKLLVEIGKKLL